MFAWGFVVACVILYFLLSKTKTVQNLENAPQTNLDNLKQKIGESGATGIEYISYNSKSAAVIDEEREKIFIYYVINRNQHNHFNFDFESFDISDLIESELIVDNQTITKTARGGQVAGAVIGGAILGGVGAIIGGLSSSKKNIENIDSIEIKLTVNNLSNPIHKINFLNNETSKYHKIKNGSHKESFLGKTAIKQAEKWQGMFDAILKNNSN